MNIKEQLYLKIREFEVLVLKKDIKNLHLNILPPEGIVRVSAPLKMEDETIKLFLITRLPWIRKNIKNFQNQARQTERRYISGETHYFKGCAYLLNVIKQDETKRIRVKVRNKKYIDLFVNPKSTIEEKERCFENLYRRELRKELPAYFAKWQEIIGVSPNEIKIKKMKTKWGVCNAKAKRIWLNLELIKKPFHSLEYIIVHELVHLLEEKHNDKFRNYMNEYLPKWELHKRELNEFIL